MQRWNCNEGNVICDAKTLLHLDIYPPYDAATTGSFMVRLACRLLLMAIAIPDRRGASLDSRAWSKRFTLRLIGVGIIYLHH